MWDPERDDDYRVRWWLAILGVPWLRILIFVGFGLSVFALVFLSPTHRDGTPLSPGDRALKLLFLTILALLVARIDHRRRRERAIRIAEGADDDAQGLEEDREPQPRVDRAGSPSSSVEP